MSNSPMIDVNSLLSANSNRRHWKSSWPPKYLIAMERAATANKLEAKLPTKTRETKRKPKI